MTNYACGHLTHVGNIRPHNEDCYAVDEELGFGVLADGMGGHESGEVASKIVVDCVCQEIQKGKPMAEALVNAHRAVLKAAENGEGRQGMGSTVIAVKMGASQFEVVWVGDSRAYLWDKGVDEGKLTQLTKDHSLVQQMVDEGTITPAEACIHPQRNYITQAIGMSELIRLEVGRVQGNLYRGQQILLCSDGLSGEVSIAEMMEIFNQELTEQQTVDLLIDKALGNGGSDNVTVVLISASKDAPLKEVNTA